MRLSNGNKEALSSEVLSRSSSGGSSSVRLGNTASSGGGENGYAAVPTDRPSWEESRESFLDKDGKEIRH